MRRNTGDMDLAERRIDRPGQRPPRAGDLLVSAPGLLDPNFRRTVIYLLQHDEEGSAGVVINRRFGDDLTGLDLPQWVLESSPIRAGGPVAQDSLLALAGTETTPVHVRRAVGPGVCVVDLEALPDEVPFHPLQLFVGYAGWSAGQLEDELARDDWAVMAADPADLLLIDPDRVWEAVLRRQRDSTRLWATLPAVPSHN